MTRIMTRNGYGVIMAIMVCLVMVPALVFGSSLSPSELTSYLHSSDSDPDVVRYLARSALHSTHDELAALERQSMTFDEEGNNVMLMHHEAGISNAVLDDDIDRAVNRRAAQLWRAENYYGNEQATNDVELQTQPILLQTDEQVDQASDLDVDMEQYLASAANEGNTVEEAAANRADLDSDEAAIVKMQAEENELDDFLANSVVEAPAAAARRSPSVLNFVELAAAVHDAIKFTPEAALKHEKAVGAIRARRLKSERTQKRRNRSIANKDNPRAGEHSENFGVYDERRAAEEARVLDPATVAGLVAERQARKGSVRPIGVSAAPFCPSFPFCHQTPAPLPMTNLPSPEDKDVIRAEMARLDPMKFLPQKLAELKQDPHRFGIVFQSIYDRNHHNHPRMNTQQAAKEQLDAVTAAN